MSFCEKFEKLASDCEFSIENPYQSVRALELRANSEKNQFDFITIKDFLD